MKQICKQGERRKRFITRRNRKTRVLGGTLLQQSVTGYAGSLGAAAQLNCQPGIGEKTSQVDAQIGELARLSGQILDRVDILERRLSGVLLEVPPSPAQSGTSATRPSLVPKAETLREIAYTLQSSLDHVADILERLEV